VRTNPLSIRFLILLTSLLACAPARAGEVTPPEKFIGHPVAADFTLDSWEKIVAYFKHVDEASDRVALQTLGQTTEGRPMIIAVISAPETIRDLDRHRDNQRRVADPRRIPTDEEQQRLVRDSKTVVMISCNLHSSEIASSQMVLELVYELATSDSAKVREILDHTILLLVPSANPDGLDTVINWYEPTRGKPWEGTGMPWLYHKYAGHDNNRDWFMLALQETRLLTKVLYEQWFPTIVYDIHQMGSSNARFFLPPFHDPKNGNVHPLIDQSLLIIGGHMATELAREKKSGVVHGAMFDNWWSGGFRTTPYRHNMVGILTEAASPLVATPIFQRKSDLRGGGRGMPEYAMTTGFPDPWPGGWWRLRDVADYEKIACYSLLTLAARYHDMFQGNYVQLGREAIKRGQNEPPFAWLVLAEQRDPGTTAKMLGILRATGLEIHRADAPFEADNVKYPEGTHILYCAQPYRAHLNDMFELQVYPDRSRTPGGPAEAPYDIAGWTLPLQMGVKQVPVSRPFEARVSKLADISAAASTISGPTAAQQYVVPPGSSDMYRLVNRLHAAGIQVSRLHDTRDIKLVGKTGPQPGSLLIHNGARFREASTDLLKGLSLDIVGLPDGITPAGQSPIGSVRLGLYQPWVASMDEGWTRLVLDDFGFRYSTLHNAEIMAGTLNDRYDCIVLPSVTPKTILDGHAPDATAPEYVGGIGLTGLLALQDFVRDGGTLVCIDDSCDLPIEHFNIPVRNRLKGKDTKEFYCPGSVLRVSLDTKHPLCYGLPPFISGYFVQSQAFDVDPPVRATDSRSPAARFPATVVARYGDTVVLESGWIRGEKLIADQPAIVEVQYGDGRIILLGFRVQHRAQPHGTFPLLFNAILRSGGKVKSE
jgi:zinc carboxypeptidase